MNRQEYLKAVKDVIYLAYCAVNERVPSSGRVAKMDLDKVYKASESHLLTAMCAMALGSAGVRDERFTQAMGKAIRKNAQMDIDRGLLLERLEEEKIWYMPLKGALLKELYPEYGMRQMSDNDILFDRTRAGDVRRIMESLGFTTERFGAGNHDIYYKQPVSNFEMHTRLFTMTPGIRLYEYYDGIKDRLIKDEENSYGYHFTPEDFYVYMVAHEFKHYSAGGTGLRSLVDTYVYLKENCVSMDLEYIESQCRKLGIDEFERQSSSLAMSLFGGEKLSAENKRMLSYIVFSGTYGTVDNRVKNTMDRYGKGLFAKLRYLKNRVLVPVRKSDTRYALFASYYPWYYENRLRLPLLMVSRIRRALTKNKDRTGYELGRLLKGK
ncbi:MAG: nucleotidyltransferase family protein [Ruminococcus sp.]|nr:nucleotidyltransferase family protein [Ruminococcus sp.]